MKSFRQKQEEKAARLKAEQAEQARLEEQARKEKYWQANWGDDALKSKEEQYRQIILEQEKRRAEEWEQYSQERLLKEQQAEKLRQEQANTGLGIGHEKTWQLSWKAFSTHPKIINLPMSEKVRLFKIAQQRQADQLNYYANVFSDNQRAIIGSKEPAAINYALSFTGDTNVSTRRGDLVATNFNPDDFNLPAQGFTISYWVRPDELGRDMFAIGRKAHNNERFTFGISRKNKIYIGVGANQSERAFATMLDTAGIDKATHLVQDTDDEWILVVGRWYHFAVTYAGTNAGVNNMLRKIYMNGQQIWGTGVSDPTYKGNIAWSQTGTEMSKGLSFGMRAVRGSGDSASYNNGWACGLDEVAIYDEQKDSNFIANVYNGGTNYDHTGADSLVGYWKFNEGGGTRVEDLSGNGNHGLLTNDSHGDDGGAAFAEGVPTWEETEGYK